VDVQRALPTSIPRFVLVSAVATTAFATTAVAGQAYAEPDAGRGIDGSTDETSARHSERPYDASADDSADAGSDKPPIDENRPAFLRATVNQIELGDVLVILRGQDVLVRTEDLRKAGMRVDGGVHEKRAEGDLVSLHSLAPKLTFAFSEVELSLTITADPSFFGAVAVDLRTKRPEGIVYASSPSLFANYQLQATDLQERNSSHLGAFTEAGLSYRGFLLYSSGNYNSRPSESYGRLFHNNEWIRMTTNLTYDWRERLTRLVAGDLMVGSGDVLGGGGTLAGVGAVRTFALDPYFVFLPSLALSGTALTPSTVEVYVNGQLIKREVLPPGQFNLQNVPLTNGSGETRVVVRDAFGGQQTMVNPYYLALGTLAKGLSDFGYNVGFVRKGFGNESWSYGQPALAIRHRVGVLDWLTVGGRAEATRDMLSGGASVATRLVFGRLRLGELGFSMAASRQSELAGFAGLLSYSYVGSPILAQLGMRFASDHYANLSLAPWADRQRVDVNATGAITVNKVGSFALQVDHAVMRDLGRTDTIALRINRSMLRWLYVFAEVDNVYRTSYPVEFRTFVGLTFSIAERTMAAMSRGDHWGYQGGHGESSQAMVQHALPVGTGIGYRLAVAQGENDLNDGMVQYQGRYGRVEAEYQHSGWDASARGHTTLTATGGAVLIGGRAYLTRPVQDAFALIRVPDVGGVHGLVSNQVVGATDRKGDLLIPSLLSYYGNRIGIDDKDIPLDHDIVATELTIAPPYRGGAIVTFPVRQIFSVAGTVVVEEGGKDTAPAYGQLVVTVAGQSVVSPFDEAGNFYLENVSPGTYLAEAQYATGSCSFQLTVQPGRMALVNVGTVRCIVPHKEPE
jgi:outer membrane usher protein